ncbi:hypothetical protein HN51_026117 [Arachis hypogaea]|uniref:B-like cyclin n=1 Tax=Arachis hypogaea TaxID=3818 RepID=A0A445CGL5_ARAHY|nr:putative cyclin-B3-1 isoform X1 [Arachis hypogaea]QHO28647.1 Putative cyclin [Arachis hypogaea]RYR50075.1 hypothetical protein Ahy_A07g036631 [Arachis hypogaea]
MASSLTGKSREVSSRIPDSREPRPSVGGRNFKVLMENERIKVGNVLMKSVREACATSRTSATVAGNPKGGFKSMDKSNSKYVTSANKNVRKALADVSNVQGNSATNIGRDSSKMKGLAGSNIKKGGGITLRKSFTGIMQRNRSNDVQSDAPKKELGIDVRPASKDQKYNSHGGPSVVTKDRFAKKPILPSNPSNSRKSLPIPRKSLPAPRKVYRADESAGSSETAKARSSLPSKATASRRVSSQLTNARNNVRKIRVSDGFTQTSQSKVLYGSSRKYIMPLKTKVIASTNHMTLKPKCISDQNISQSNATILSQDEEALPLPLPVNGLESVSNDANQGCVPSDGEKNLVVHLPELILMKKSRRKKSYTSSLMEGSKLLKQTCEVSQQDNLPNIDNDCNHLEVPEYVDDIYQYYWVSEAQNPSLANYMCIQTEITPYMRGILINWLIEVHMKFDLMPETLYLTVTLLDQYLSMVKIEKTDMQLVGLTALLLASKYEDFWHPRVKDLISISAESYTRDQMLGMEKLILRKLKFRLNVPTPYVFLVRFLKAAQSDSKLEHMAFFLIDLCLVEYEAIAFKPSLLCASALYVARCTLQIEPPWTPLLQKHAHYDISQMRGCAEMILKLHKAASIGKLKVTYEKYSRKELRLVAAVRPLDSLP